MHGRALFRLLHAAVATSTLGGCCVIGRSYGPSEVNFLAPAPAGSATPTADGALPEDVCRAACGEMPPESTLLGCWTATVEMGRKPEPRRLRWEYRDPEDKAWRNNLMELTDEHARELDAHIVGPPTNFPGERSYAPIDDAACRAFLQKRPAVAMQSCELSVVPPPPPRGAPVVVCRKRRAGGCDVSFGHGRDTRARTTAFAHPRRGLDHRAGEWLANAAAAEGIAIRAFAEIAAELRAFGAPGSLVRGARRARRDEITHARTMARFARARGGRRPRVRFRTPPPRSLEAFAIENAIEGCTRELFGAAVMIHQSQSAAPDLRPAFAIIARDETRHAALSLRIFHWCAARLERSGRARVLAAMDAAVDRILEAWAERSPTSADLGWPDARVARAIVERLRADVWGPLHEAAAA